MAEREQNNSTFLREADVRQYVTDRLEPQVGRAEAHFRDFLTREKFGPTPVRPAQSHGRFLNWTLGALSTALAASLAAVLVIPTLRSAPQGRPGVSPVPAYPVVTASELQPPTFVEQDTQSQTFDNGVAVVDRDKPMRVFLRRDLQRTRWFDHDQNLKQEQVVPQDNVIYVEMKQY